MEKYIKEIYKNFTNTKVTDKEQRDVDVEKAMDIVAKEILKVKKKNKKVIFIGNGGSAAVASHKALDFLNMLHVEAISFSDSNNLTCFSNDFGYESVFSKHMEFFAKKDDILISISSSGNSKNILNATLVAKKIGCKIYTFSGFKKENKLKKLGDLNFHTDSKHYNQVEATHLLLCDCILEKALV